MAADPPLVSVALAVHDDARYVRLAVESVLRQTFADLELIVVDDGSTDQTPALLAAVSDSRLVVLRNDEQLGLAASLNTALERSRGRYVARLDADDVAFPERLEAQVARIRAEPAAGIVGSAVLDIDGEGLPDALHRLPRGATAVRWHALFGAPFFHPTVLLDRELLDRHELRYDPSYLESEDYDLWTRLLAVTGGDNLADVLVLRRVHAGQATQRRSGLQASFQREIALREIAGLTSGLGADGAELAWGLGSGRGVPDASLAASADAYLALLEVFERAHGVDPQIREAAARTVGRAALRLGGSARRRLGRRTLGLAPRLPVGVVADRVRRPARRRTARRRAAAWLAELGVWQASAAPVRVAVVSPEPTPYRSPLFDRIAVRSEVELTVIYAARSVARRTWSVEPHHRSIFLRGVPVPGARAALDHDYPVTPGIVRALRRARPEVVVVSGWSTFASQAAIAWCRARRVPYVLLVESHDLGPRAGWRRAVKSAVVPPLVRGAAGALAVGTLARESLVARGAAAERVRVFANTVDVQAWEDRADRLAGRRDELRAGLGLGTEDVLVLSVSRLVAEKGLDDLVRAVAQTADPRLALVVAGSGPEGSGLARLAEELGVRLRLAGDLPEERLAEAYVAADVFALLSRREPWGVVVNEAAASGLPLLLSNRVGASRDLLRHGQNGALVPAEDVGAAATALAHMTAAPERRKSAGARSRALVRGWGYEPSVESFVAAVLEAAAR